MNTPSVTAELLLRQTLVLLREADAANAAGDPSTYGLQRQARETLAAALDLAEVRHG